MNSTWETVGKGHNKIASVVHVSTKSPKSWNKQFSTNSFRFLSPNLFAWISFELILLWIWPSENVISNSIKGHINNKENNISNSFMIRIIDQIMALDWEDKRNKNVVSKNKHVPKFFINDVPGCKHFLLVPKVIQNIESWSKLITKHSQCNWTCLLNL